VPPKLRCEELKGQLSNALSTIVNESSVAKILPVLVLNSVSALNDRLEKMRDLVREGGAWAINVAQVCHDTLERR